MQSFEIDKRKRKKALKQIVKQNLKSAKGFVKFCYVFTWFLRITAIILGLVTIVYVISLKDRWFRLIFLILTFLFPYLFSYIPAAVYIISAGGEYRLRRNEDITIGKEGFVYSFRDDRVGLSDAIIAFSISYQHIKKFTYDDNTKILTLFGKIRGDMYENGEIKSTDECSEVSLLDVYENSIKQLLEDNCKCGGMKHE